MSRRIVCEACGAKRQDIDPRDKANGFKRRVVKIIARKPANHGVTYYAGDTIATLEKVAQKQLPCIQCDDCGTDIPDGALAVCISMWRSVEPIPPWEHEYGEVVP